MRKVPVIALWLVSLFLLFACRAKKEVVSQLELQKDIIVRHDTVRVREHRVDSFFRYDSVFVSQKTVRDTVYVTKEVFRKERQRESKTKSDSVKAVEKHKAVAEKKEEKETVREPSLWEKYGKGIIISVFIVVFYYVLRTPKYENRE